MKWSSAIRKLQDLANAGTDLAASPAAEFSLPVTQLWAFGPVLGLPDDLERVHVAVVVDLPVAEVPWLTKPFGAEHWENTTRTAKQPIVTLWRSARAPVWNHHVERPALFWEREAGLAEDVLEALSEGRADDVRIPAPTLEEFRARIAEDVAVSLATVRERTQAYESRRWDRGGFTAAADALWEATNGYVDLLDA